MFSPHPYGHQYATIVRKLLQVDIKVVELLLHTAMCTAKRRREKNVKIEMFPLANYSFSRDREKSSAWMNVVKYGRFSCFVEDGIQYDL